MRWLALALSLLVFATSVDAQDSSAEQQARSYDEATRAEAAVDPEAAYRAFSEVVSLGAGTRLGRRASDRAEWLRARSEDSFVPLRALLQFDSQPSTSQSRATLRHAMESMPNGRVRAESALRLASSMARAGESREAIEVYRSLASNPSLHEDERRLAAEEVAKLYSGVGEVERALAVLEANDREDSGAYVAYSRDARRRWMEPLSWTVIATFVLVAAAVLWRSRDRSQPLPHGSPNAQ